MLEWCVICLVEFEVEFMEEFPFLLGFFVVYKEMCCIFSLFTVITKRYLKVSLICSSLDVFICSSCKVQHFVKNIMIFW